MALRPNEQQINAGLLALRDKLTDKIAGKGGEPDSTSLNTLADSVDTIPQGMSKLPGGFQLHPDWWDIIKMMDTITDPAGNKPNVAVLISDSLASGNLAAYGSTWVYTTDGYEGVPVAHTWNWSKGKPCSEGYKTHAVLGWGLTAASISGLAGNNAIVVKTGAINITSYALGGTSTYAAALDGMTYTQTKQVRAILCTDETTANSNAMTSYGMSGLRNLERLEVANGITGWGTATNGCAYKELVIPKSMTVSGDWQPTDSLRTIRYLKAHGIARLDGHNLEVWEVYAGETYFTSNVEWVRSYRLSPAGLYKLAQDLAPHPNAGTTYAIRLNSNVLDRLLAVYPDVNDIMASKGYAFI